MFQINLLVKVRNLLRVIFLQAHALVATATILQEHAVQSGELLSGVPSVPAQSMSEEETFSTSDLETGNVAISGSTIIQRS